MRRYFFDVRDDFHFRADAEGMMLPNFSAARVEASRALADMARDMIRLECGDQIAIEVRDEGGPIAKARFGWSFYQTH